jgi:hypothetical protein
LTEARTRWAFPWRACRARYRWGYFWTSPELVASQIASNSPPRRVALPLAPHRPPRDSDDFCVQLTTFCSGAALVVCNVAEVVCNARCRQDHPGEPLPPQLPVLYASLKNGTYDTV